MKPQTKEELLQEIEKDYALLRYYNCLYGYFLIVDEQLHCPNKFIINELKQVIFNLLTANPNEDFSLKKLTADNFLLSYAQREIVCDVTSNVYQNYNSSEENNDFKNDEQYINFVDAMPDDELKKQLQAFNRELVLLEQNLAPVKTPITRDNSIRRFRRFSNQNLNEVLLNKTYPNFKISKEIISYLNEKRKNGKLSDNQFNLFVKEYVAQLLGIIYQRMQEDPESASIFAGSIQSVILSEIKRICPQGLNDGFRAFLREQDSNTFIDFLKFFYNETPQDKYLDSKELQKIVLEELANYGNDESLGLMQYYEMIREIFSPQNCIISEKDDNLIKYFLDLPRKRGGKNPLPAILTIPLPNNIFEYISKGYLKDELSITRMIEILKSRADADSNEVQKLIRKLKYIQIVRKREEVIMNYDGATLPSAYARYLRNNGYDDYAYLMSLSQSRKCDLREDREKLIKVKVKDR